MKTGMLRTYIVCLSMILSLVLATVTQARFLPDAEDRIKRQSADVKTAEYLAYIALGGKIPHGCPDIACGLVDVIASGRKKRSVPFIEKLDPVQRYRLLQGLLLAAETKVNSDI